MSLISSQLLDVYCGSCLAFTLAALVESLLVISLYKKERGHACNDKSHLALLGSTEVPGRNIKVVLSTFIELVSRIVFPLLFIIFNWIYWMHCLELNSAQSNKFVNRLD